MKKVIVIKTNWDSKRKSGGWCATCNGKRVSGNLYSTTSDQLALTGMIEGVKEFGDSGDTVRIVTKNTRAQHAVQRPAASIHCAYGREFRAVCKAAGVHYTFR